MSNPTVPFIKLLFGIYGLNSVYKGLQQARVQWFQEAETWLLLRLKWAITNISQADAASILNDGATEVSNLPSSSAHIRQLWGTH